MRSARVLTALAAVIAAAVLALPLTASADLAQEEHEGQALAESVMSGEMNCSQISADDFELIGEYAMGRYLADPAAHEAMNRRMTWTMGKGGEQRMHIALGYRYGECEGGPAARWVGAMSGMMYGDYGVGDSGRHNGSGMMGGGHHGGDIATWGVVLIGVAAALLGGGMAALVMHRRQPAD